MFIAYWRNRIDQSWCLKRLDKKPVEWQKQILKVVKLKMKKLKWHLSLMLCQDNETFACESHDSWLKHLVEDLHWPKPNQEERKQASKRSRNRKSGERKRKSSFTNRISWIKHSKVFNVWRIFVIPKTSIKSLDNLFFFCLVSDMPSKKINFKDFLNKNCKYFRGLFGLFWIIS